MLRRERGGDNVWHQGGLVEAVFYKRAHGEDPVPRRSIELVCGLGVSGDRSARPDSPRQVLLVGRSTLDRFALSPGMLRENVTVVDIEPDEIPSGAEVVIGDARLRVTIPCEPCAVITGYTGVRVKDLVGLRGSFGVVTQSGSVTPNDSIAVGERRYEPIPADYLERIAWLATKIPKGKAMTYVDAVKALGMPKGSIRRMPLVLKQLDAHRLATYRIAASGTDVPLRPGQRDALANEGVAFRDGHVDWGSCSWVATAIFGQSEAATTTANLPITV